MKKTIIILLLAGQSILGYAQSKWDKEPYLTKSLKGDAIKTVFAKTSGGSIWVAGTAAGEEARIEVYLNTNNGNNDLSKEELTKRLQENYQLDITTDGGELHVTAKNKTNHWDNDRSLSISFKIYVPNQSATNLTTSGGSIHLTNLKGEQNFTTSGGSLHIDALNGVIRGRTSGGSITANNCEGNIELTTSGGSLNLNNLKGITHAQTSGGSVRGGDIQGELITSTSGGSITLKDLACSIDAHTSAGSVHVQLKSLGKYVRLGVSAGRIDLQIPAKQGADLNLQGNRVTATLPASFSGTQEKNEVQGKINGGGARVDVNASSGSVTLAFN